MTHDYQRHGTTSLFADSVAQLERAISHFVEHWNQDAQPLVWTKTAG